MHEGNPVLNIQIGGNGASTARLYILTGFKNATLTSWYILQSRVNVNFLFFEDVIMKWPLPPTLKFNCTPELDGIIAS